VSKKENLIIPDVALFIVSIVLSLPILLIQYFLSFGNAFDYSGKISFFETMFLVPIIISSAGPHEGILSIISLVIIPILINSSIIYWLLKLFIKIIK